jgi:diacylglycerol kinase
LNPFFPLEVLMTILPPSFSESFDCAEPLPVRKPRRAWRDKFHDAFRGLKLGIRGHSSFFVHFFFAALVVAAAMALRCGPLEWCVLLGCIGMVLTAELFNSAIETIFHGLDEETKPRVKGCLDIAAGAVLMASLAAALIGGIVFLGRLLKFLVW